MSKNSLSRIENAVAVELAKLARIESNIDAAVADGRISAHDGDERKARAGQTAANRIAFTRGEKRPRQRAQQPLDNPSAGIVG